MNTRTKMLSVALALTVVAAGIYFVTAANDAKVPALTHRPIERSHKMSAAFAKAFEKIREAEKIADAEERCLKYPDPPWIHWNHDIIAAFCQSRSFHHVTLAEIRRMLDARRADNVEATFKEYQAAHFNNPKLHGILTRVYRELFFAPTDQVRDIVEEWIKLAPNSAFALAARGAYYNNKADEARGEDLAWRTPRESMAEMRRLALQAISDLQKAVKIDPKVTPAYDVLIFAAQSAGDDTLMRSTIQAALSVDPIDERFYLDWMSTSEPRWGGSLEEMAQVAEQGQKHIDRNPLLGLLLEKQRAYYGTVAEHADRYRESLTYFDSGFEYGPSPVDLDSAGYAAGQLGDYEEAVWYYSEAARFNPSNPSNSLTSRSWALNKMERPDLAAADLQTVSAMTAHGSDSLLDQAYAATSAGRFPDAEEIYLNILQQNPRNSDALERLARLYIYQLNRSADAEPHVVTLQRYYPNSASTWLITAQFARGRDEKMCHDALEKYLSLVDQDDPSEKENIEAVRRRLDELSSGVHDQSNSHQL